MTVRAKYLRIPEDKWTEYQHYQRKVENPEWRPHWIKLYVKMLDTFPFRDFSPQTKWCYVGMILIAAETHNLITNDALILAKRLAISKNEVVKAVETLVQNGLLEGKTATSSRRDLDSDYSLNKNKSKKKKERSAVHTVARGLEQHLDSINAKMRELS